MTKPTKTIGFTDNAKWQHWMFLIGIWLIVTLIEFVGGWQPLISSTELLMRTPLRLSHDLVWRLESPYRVLTKSVNSASRIQDLELRLSEVLAQVSELESLRQENSELRGLLENTNRTMRPVAITTPIVSLSSPALSGGKNLGINSGNPVLISQVLVGLVDQVTDNFSTVTLLNSPGKITVVAKTSSGAQGVITGDGKRILLTEVPSDAPVTVGEQVVTLGQKGVERDLFIGKVSQIRLEPTSAVKTLVIDQIVKFDQARVAEVYL